MTAKAKLLAAMISAAEGFVRHWGTGVFAIVTPLFGSREVFARMFRFMGLILPCRFAAHFGLDRNVKGLNWTIIEAWNRIFPLLLH